MVASDGLREAVLFEGFLKDPKGGSFLGAYKCFAINQEACGKIRNRKRVAISLAS